ncbi:hypothetical protein BJX99DRAFT_232413 [Aspergillus californicus]
MKLGLLNLLVRPRTGVACNAAKDTSPACRCSPGWVGKSLRNNIKPCLEIMLLGFSLQ